MTEAIEKLRAELLAIQSEDAGVDFTDLVEETERADSFLLRLVSAAKPEPPDANLDPTTIQGELRLSLLTVNDLIRDEVEPSREMLDTVEAALTRLGKLADDLDAVLHEGGAS